MEGRLLSRWMLFRAGFTSAGDDVVQSRWMFFYGENVVESKWMF